MKKALYHYKAKVTEVYDGDTLTVDVDLGMHIFLKDEKVRLNRINTPGAKEPEKEKGIKVKDFLRELILNKKIILETLKNKGVT